MNQVKDQKDNILMKSNKFIMARYDLQTIENRLFVRLLYEFQKNKNLEITITIEEVRELMKNPNYTTPQAISKIFTKLRTGTIYIKDDDSWGECSFIYHWIYNEKDKTYTVKTSAELLDLIENYIQVGYTPINLQIFFSLRNSYAQRFYDLLRLWTRTKNKITYTLDVLKELLLLEDKYSKYNDLKRRVIVPAIQELNSTEYFDIDFKEIKKSRKVVAIEFSVKDLDKRKYFDKNVVETVIYEEQEESKETGTTIEFYIPDETAFTKGTIRLFKIDFKEFDFKKDIYIQAFDKALAIALERDNTDIINTKNYDFFKSTLSNKISEVIIHQKDEIKFKEELDKYWDDEDVKKEEREVDYSKDPVRLEIVRRNLFDQGLVNEEGYYYK
ncbi:replication initiation protein [Clostridioides sp. ZZV15-6598]|uniref:replication initiation protein n=1 Tax=Clostridioides sp. ZZV15-6598 TaxID=2811501 RepID=UPI001D11513E|nr:replication initiation protein [Clostridioides sp. ZZV15-6598]